MAPVGESKSDTPKNPTEDTKQTAQIQEAPEIGTEEPEDAAVLNPDGTSGKLDTLAFADLMEIELIQKILQTLLSLGFRELLGHLHNGHYIVFHGHMSEHGSLLCEIADSHLGTLVHRKTGDLLIVKEYLSRIRHNKSGNHIEAGSLSGTVRTEEAYDLSLIHLHRYPFHYSPGSVFLDKIFAT